MVEHDVENYRTSPHHHATLQGHLAHVLLIKFSEMSEPILI